MLTGMPTIVESGNRARYKELVKLNPGKMQAPDEREEWARAVLGRREQVESWQHQDALRLTEDAMSPLRTKRDGSTPLNTHDLCADDMLLRHPAYYPDPERLYRLICTAREFARYYNAAAAAGNRQLSITQKKRLSGLQTTVSCLSGTVSTLPGT